MAVPAHVRPILPPSPCLAEALYRLDVRQYEKMLDDGTIAEDERVELIEGLLVAKSRRSRAAIVAGNKTLRILWRMIPPGWHVAKGVPIQTSDWSRPEPDLAVIRGVVEDYDERDATSGDTALVVKIAENHLSAARTDMARLYAMAGIPVYWIVNLVDRQVEVYSDPRRGQYRASQVFKPGHDVPLVIDGVEVGRIAVADLLP